ncbi:MAG: hypothetical protein D6820_04135, partial [Lentisphaerae bacterium]
MRKQPPPRLIMWLVDGLDFRLIHHYLDAMPTVRQVMKEGFYGQVLPFISTWGNIDFMSLLCGAPPGAHYHVHRRDDLPPWCTAQPLWQSLAATGGKSALIDLPQSWPSGSALAEVA